MRLTSISTVTQTKRKGPRREGTNPSQATDAELVAAFRSGEHAAFEQLVRRYFGLVHTVAYARLRNNEAAEDLAQEVFLRLYLAIGSLRDPQYFGTWASRITRNLASDWLRHDQRVSRLLRMVPLEEEPQVQMKPLLTPDAREQLCAEEQKKALEEAILRLPQEQREVVLLYYGEGMTQEEVAHRLEVHHTTVGRHLRLAMRSLKRWSGELEKGDRFPRVPAGPALARTLVTLSVVSAVSGEARVALASAAAETGGTALGSSAVTLAAKTASTANVFAPGVFGQAAVCVVKGYAMTAKMKLGLGGIAAALVLSGSYHMTHPGELRQLFRPPGRAKIDRGNPFRATGASYVPPIEPGERAYHGSITDAVKEIVVRVGKTPEGEVKAEFDVPHILMTEYPLRVVSAEGQFLHLEAAGQFGLRVKDEGDALRGTAYMITRNVRNGELSTSPVELKRVNASLPIAREMPKQGTVADSELDRYLGRYHTNAVTALTITRKGRQLYAQTTGQDPLPIYPKEKDRFFYRAIPAELSFPADAKGKITRLVLHQDRDISARKVR